MGLPIGEMRVTSYMINILFFVFYRYGRITIFYAHDEILLFQYYLEGVRSENKINVSFEKEKKTDLLWAISVVHQGNPPTL